MTAISKHNQFLRKIFPIFGVIICIGIWEANSYFRCYQIIAPSLPASAFPSFFAIIKKLLNLFAQSGIWGAMGTTVARTVSAFVIAAFFGTILGLLAGRMPGVGALLDIPVEFFRNLPAIAAMPIFILFLGIGSTMKIALCVFGALFPVFIAARMGIQNISEEMHIAARFYGWTGWRLVFLVLLPSALPEIAIAGQTALAISLILAVMGEMLIGGDGIGSMIVDAERTFNHLDLYALVLVLGIVGCVLALGFRWTASRLIFWKTAVNWQRS